MMGCVPLDAELADLREFLASRGVDHPPERLAEIFGPRGTRLAPDDVVAVRSGALGADGVVSDDALLLVRPATRSGGRPAAAGARRRDHRAGPRARPRRVGRVGAGRRRPARPRRRPAARRTRRRPGRRGRDPRADPRRPGRRHAAAGGAARAPGRPRGAGAARPPRDLRPRLPAGGVPRGGGADAAGAGGVHAGAPQAAAPRRRAARVAGRGAAALDGARALRDCPPGGPTTPSATRSRAPSSTSASVAELGRDRELTLRDLRLPTGWWPRTRRRWRRRWWRTRRRVRAVLRLSASSR